MDYKNKLIDFWGEIFKFHDDDIMSIDLNRGTLTLLIKTKVSKVLHPKHIYENFTTVFTTLTFCDVKMNILDIDSAGIIISKFCIEECDNNCKCVIEGVLGSMEFDYSTVKDIQIKTIKKD